MEALCLLDVILDRVLEVRLVAVVAREKRPCFGAIFRKFSFLTLHVSFRHLARMKMVFY